MVLILSNWIYVNTNFPLEILLLNRADSCSGIKIQGENLFRHAVEARKHK